MELKDLLNEITNDLERVGNAPNSFEMAWGLGELIVKYNKMRGTAPDLSDEIISELERRPND